MLLAWGMNYLNHLDIAATKNKHLIAEEVRKIKSETEIWFIKEQYIRLIQGSREFRIKHNSEAEQTLHVMLLIILLIIVNTIMSIKVFRGNGKPPNKSLKNGTREERRAP